MDEIRYAQSPLPTQAAGRLRRAIAYCARFARSEAKVDSSAGEQAAPLGTSYKAPYNDMAGLSPGLHPNQTKSDQSGKPGASPPPLAPALT